MHVIWNATKRAHFTDVTEGSSGDGTECDEAVGETGQAQSWLAGVSVAVQRGINGVNVCVYGKQRVSQCFAFWRDAVQSKHFTCCSLSVRPSVRPSRHTRDLVHKLIVKLSQRLAVLSISFPFTKQRGDIPTVTGADKYRFGMKNSQFSTNIQLYLGISR